MKELATRAPNPLRRLAVRVLCTTQPLYGHFHSLMPYALALQAEGHEVAFATARGFVPVIERLGFRAFPCGVDYEAATEIFSHLPGCRALLDQGAPLVFAQLWGFILGLGPQMAADLLDSVASWQPDLLLRDPVEFGGYIAAERWGIPHASVLWAIYIDPCVWIPPWLEELSARFHLPGRVSERYNRWLVLKALPAAWSITPPGEPPTTRAYRVPPFDRSMDDRSMDDRSVELPLPAWLAHLPPRPTVYATLGTTFNQAPGHFRSVIDGLAALDVNGIVTVGHGMDPAQFGALPANVHVERFIPQSALLPTCAAVLFHGGFNTLHGALWHGLPLVALPLEAGDQQPTADKCAALGVGRTVALGPAGQPPPPAAVAEAVCAVLEQPAYGERARQLAAAMHGLPPLRDAVRLMERIAAR